MTAALPTVHGAPGSSANADLARLREQNSPEAVREAARQFEALFVKMMLDTANETSFGPDGLGEGGDMVRGMWTGAMAKQMASGEGFGIADMMMRQFGLEDGPKVVPARPPISARAAAPAAEAAYVEAAPAPRAPFASREDFVNAIRPHAEAAAAELGVSPKLIIAQAALESDWGRRTPTDSHGRQSQNLFGIKADSRWQGKVAQAGTQEFVDGAMRRETATFRRYDSIGDSVRDYVDFIKGNPRYRDALNHSGSDERYLQGLKSGGYATDPHYVDKIQRVASSELLAT